MISSEIEPATFQFAAWCLDELCYKSTGDYKGINSYSVMYKLPYILKSNLHLFYSFRGPENHM